MEQTPSPQVFKKKNKKSNKALKILPWVGTGLFIVLAAAGVYLFATKHVAISFNSTAVAPVVCSDDAVQKYNDAISFTDRNGTYGADLAGLKDIETTIRARANYAQDPTCQTILFWAAIYNNDATKGQVAYDAVSDLQGEHKYANTNLNELTSLATMKTTLANVAAGAKE